MVEFVQEMCKLNNVGFILKKEKVYQKDDKDTHLNIEDEITRSFVSPFQKITKPLFLFENFNLGSMSEKSCA